MEVSICAPKYRKPLAETLRDPAVRKLFIMLKSMGARNMRHDTMLVRQPDGSYKQFPDLSAWYADCNGGTFVAMIKHEGDTIFPGGWTLHS